MADPDADVAVVRTSNAALNRGDVEGMLTVYASDATVVDHRQVAFGTFTGHDELRALYSGIISSVSEFHAAIEILAAAGGIVVAACEATARLGPDPAAPSIEAEYGFVATVEDGLIARLELYDDGEGAREASGLSR